jgi:DNA-binding GntR family transcriptional regulator
VSNPERGSVVVTTRAPIPRAPLRAEVRRALIETLMRGDPPPGSPLSEPALAAELGISRTPLREALLALAHEGLLETTPGRGFSVAPLTAREVEEIYPMLWTLEGLALRSGPLPDAHALDALERLNESLGRAQEDPEVALETDRAWHARLLAGSDHALLAQTIAMLKNRAFRYEYAYMRGSGRVITSVSQHHDIIAALRHGDRDTAVTRLESNWRVSVNYLLPWLAGGGHAHSGR